MNIKTRGFIVLLGFAAILFTSGPVNAKKDADKTRSNYKERAKARDRYRELVKQTPLPPARVLLGKAAYARYRANIWNGRCNEADDILEPVVEKKYPHFKKLHAKIMPSSIFGWWTSVSTTYFRENSGCTQVEFLLDSKKRMHAYRTGTAPEKTTHPSWIPSRLDRERIFRVYGFNTYGLEREDNEVTMIEYARFLLEFIDTYKPHWAGIQSEMPLYLLLRGAMVAKQRGDPDSKPDDYDALVERAKTLAGGARSLAAVKFAKTMASRDYLKKILERRLFFIGLTLDEARRLPPFFQRYRRDWRLDRVKKAWRAVAGRDKRVRRLK